MTPYLIALALAQPAAPPAGFTPIFNGKDTTGWVAWAIHDKGAGPTDVVTAPALAKAVAWAEDAKKHWSVENAELVNDGNGAYLASLKEYGDYELLIEYKTVAKADSGIYLKGAPQVQIWDYTDPAKKDLGAHLGSGGLWNNTKGNAGKDPLAKADKPFGEWNKFRIIQLGERTTVYLNDVLVVDHARMENYYNRAAPLPKKGSIVLQTHGGEIRWRNLFVREIPAAEANETLRKKASEGHEPLFNGTDLTGWAGAVANYEAVGGAIRCKPGKGGVLHTAKEYSDFSATVEFKLPKGGNNGLAIRYPGGDVDTAYHGMTELQVLDDTDAKYAKLDPRQYHGSAYAMAAAHRGYQRPVGEWNFQQVTVAGSKITVELNGTRILDTDLAPIKEFMANSPHPGKTRTTGSFGFAGHGDAVQFRNVAIKSLK